MRVASSRPLGVLGLIEFLSLRIVHVKLLFVVAKNKFYRVLFPE
jgi:hypothetical protein